MASIKHVFFMLISIISFVYTFYVVGKLMVFLSSPKSLPKEYVWVFNLIDNHSRLNTAIPPLVSDSLYIIAFILQHSCMKSDVVKSFMKKIGLEAAERSIYCLTSSFCLQYLVNNWVPAQSIILWEVDVANSSFLWWAFTLVHSFAWLVIYGGSIIMDLPEILGIKQTYFDMNKFAPPIAYKSFELRHLYSHVRHPSFIGLSVVFWATNLMSLDRLLLAIMMTVYMYVGWSTDYNDVIYQKCQLERKSYELKRDM